MQADALSGELGRGALTAMTDFAGPGPPSTRKTVLGGRPGVARTSSMMAL